MTESPISADFDNSLSSCDASNNDLSEYESEDVSDGDEPYGSSESSYSLGSQSPSYGYSTSGGCDYYVSYGYTDSCESFDYPLSCKTVVFQDLCDEYVSCKLSDSLGSCDFSDSVESQTDVEFEMVCDVGQEPTLKAVENDVILKNYNEKPETVDIDSSPGNIILSASMPSAKKVIDDDSIMDEVKCAMDTSECYSFDVAPQIKNLVEFNHDDAVLADVSIGLAIICNSGEPVFDGILMASGYVSGKEAYFGSMSDSELKTLLEYIGAENVILFASLTENWDSDDAFNILSVASCEHFNEFEIDGYKFTKALLNCYPSTGDVVISLGDNEDKHNHVYDTNSHGLDYAYVKHVNVIYKDMPKLMVLTSSGCEDESTEGSWDGLNDILGIGISSETLLPDHKAIWTPLLLLTQQDLEKSNEDSHADDNGNTTLNAAKNSNTKSDCKCKGCNTTNCTCKNCNCNISKCSCHKHHHGGGGHHHRHWGHNGYDGYYCYVASAAVVTGDLNKSDNSTDDKNKSSNVTATGKNQKSSGSPNDQPNAEPTYTLVYAIIGIALISLLFNSSYMKRDE